MKLIDSSLWVEFLRRRGDVNVKQMVARLLRSEQAAFTCPIRFELLSGARPEEENDLNEALSLSLHIPFEQEDWQEAARWERRFRAQGLQIPRNDLFVATVAMRAGVPVVCRDAHFSAAQKATSEKLKVEQI